MLAYITRKLLYSISVLFGIVTVVFLLFTALPGDPARLMLGQRADQSEVEMIRKDLGLDLPLSTQYLVYLNDLSPLSFWPWQKVQGMISCLSIICHRAVHV